MAAICFAREPFNILIKKEKKKEPFNILIKKKKKKEEDRN